MFIYDAGHKESYPSACLRYYWGNGAGMRGNDEWWLQRYEKPAQITPAHPGGPQIQNKGIIHCVILTGCYQDSLTGPKDRFLLQSSQLLYSG